VFYAEVVVFRSEYKQGTLWGREWFCFLQLSSTTFSSFFGKCTYQWRKI